MGHVQLLHCEAANQKRAVWKQFKCNMTITWLIANEISLMQIITAATLYSNYEFYDAMASLDDVLSSPYSWLNIQWGLWRGYNSRNQTYWCCHVRKCKQKWQCMQEQWESGNYVMSRQSLTFSLGNNFTFKSQNSTRSGQICIRLFLLLVHLFPQLN